MWFISVRDLLFRKRRFAIAIVSAAAVFAQALVLAGMSTGFRVEADRTIGATGADAWIVPAGVPGPFTSFRTMPASLAATVAAMPGVRRADPFVFLRQTVREQGGKLRDVNVLGHPIGGLGEPPPAEGRRATASDEAVVDDKLGLHVGQRFVLGRWRFRVSGVVHGMTAAAGIPDVFVPLETAQVIGFQGQPVATAVITRGIPRSGPRGFTVMTDAQARGDILRPLASGVSSMDSSRDFLWILAALIIGAVVYLSTLERVRDFAVFKATGASSRALFAGLALQSVLVALVAAALASGLAQLLKPVFPLTVVIPGNAYLLLPAIALVVGLVASLAGLRRAVAVDPAQAFGAM